MPASRSPFVALTAATDTSSGLRRARINESYLRALEAHGLTPIVVPPLENGGAAERVIEAVGGLVLSGGEDVEPARYGAAPHPKLARVSAARDRWELELIESARARRTPILAICRGIQVLNVALGGTLVQDIPSQRPSAVAHEPADGRLNRVHGLEVTKGSRLARILGATTLTVNSVHHQAIDGVAPGLEVVARSPDDLIEGVEVDDDGWWVVGVQWHPEDLALEPRSPDGSLFGAFADAVKSFASPDALPRAAVR